MDIISIITTTAISSVTAAAIGGVIAWVGSRRDKRKRDLEEGKTLSEGVTNACKIILRKGLKESYEYYSAQGYCPMQEKEEIENEYKVYHDELKGNNQGTRYYEAIMSLPEKKSE